MKQSQKLQHKYFNTSLENLFSSEVFVCLSQISDYTQHLFPEEQLHIKTAVGKRCHEFSTGRYCAHNAMQTLVTNKQALVAGEKREPLWPDGIIGSISHSGDCCIAIVSADPSLIALGCDVEKNEPSGLNIRDMICTEQDLHYLGERGDDPYAWKLIFSAKESIYKCLYPLLKHWIGFADATVICDFDAGSYRVLMSEKLNIPENIVSKMQGRFIVGEDYIFTSMIVSL